MDAPVQGLLTPPRPDAGAQIIEGPDEIQSHVMNRATVDCFASLAMTSRACPCHCERSEAISAVMVVRLVTRRTGLRELSAEQDAVEDGVSDVVGEALEAGLEPYELVLRESDDYELIITCPGDSVEKIRSTVASVSDSNLARVGRMTGRDPGSMELVFPDGSRRPVSPAGWDHFSKKE